MAEIEKSFDTDNHRVECRICGAYAITIEALMEVETGEFVTLRHLLSGQARLANLRGEELQVTTKNGRDIAESARVPASPMEAMDQTLFVMKHKTKSVGDWVQLGADDYPYILAQKNSEFTYVLNALVKEGLAENTGSGNYRPTLAGWRRLEDLGVDRLDSQKAFVAMWFNPDMRESWEKGIKPALVDTGYSPIRVDVLEHNNKIDDLIIDEIRQSSLLVADFTGHRGGVYFEAGFAMGLGIPVIWTCREGHEKCLHFDTRQYNHIIWSGPDDLRMRLTSRIGATVGRRRRRVKQPG